MSPYKGLLSGKLGQNGPRVPRLGAGLMSLSGIYGEPMPDADRLAFLDGLHERGAVFWE